MSKQKIVMSWSGGKDSSMALYEVLKKGDLVIRLKLGETRNLPAENQSENMREEETSIPINPFKNELPREDKAANIIFGFEQTRIRSKIQKIKAYWAKTSLLVPNVNRLLRADEINLLNFVELQDYSRKELLVQSNGQRFKPKNHKIKGKRRVSFKRSSRSLRSSFVDGV